MVFSTSTGDDVILVIVAYLVIAETLLCNNDLDEHTAVFFNLVDDVITVVKDNFHLRQAGYSKRRPKNKKQLGLDLLPLLVVTCSKFIHHGLAVYHSQDPPKPFITRN
ncbi:hypothetical protein TNIN_334671 [Trichonephila inaurata madagascariensis]|uniref:Uncharacterized protein n=1 Tax=Trichonephila inaurata madagascariensis TaxID=2747483 RepID=A0A8X6YEV6_9ARAC|nr:hypothetical protein TNIN_334671 [Trichonephila inaurata madagascariensis]